jgi:hypothetical protein
MNTSSDPRSNREQDHLETDRRDADPAADTTLLELGKVSDTQGGWLGVKLDVGAGFITW